MDFDPWWLILVPILFGLGWVAARVDIRQMLSETRRLPDSYFRGLNFLLNEQPDRAIDAFIEVVKLDPETIELHFALGNLFRRRGELERAIRVHQNLMQRSDLPEPQREQALHELAQDYLKAGMLDRAEEGFVRLQSGRFAVPAVRALVRIYEAEHDWPKAIAAVHTLQTLVAEPVPQAVHYQCELAQAAMATKPPQADAVQTALDAATAALPQVDTGSAQPTASQGAVRVSLLRAQWAMLDGRPLDAQAELDQALHAYPDFAGMLAAPWLQSHQVTATLEQALQRLQQCYAQHPSQDLFDAIFQRLQASGGAAASWPFARQALQRQPSLLGLERLLQAQLAQAPSAATAELSAPQVPASAQTTPPSAWLATDDARLLHSLIHRPAQRLGRYACQACGFRARRFYWQCPGCNAWETYLPKRLEELEGS